MNTGVSDSLHYPPRVAAVLPIPTNRASVAPKPQIAWEPHVTEPSILSRIAAGDQNAVKECLDAYSGLVWSFAKRFMRNTADAEDAVQDIFTAIWLAADKYDPTIASECTYISTIARRRLIDQLRKAGRRPATESLDNDDSDQQQPIVAGRLEDTAEVAKVERVIDAMAPEIRNVLSLSLYEGYTHSEIARRMDLPLGTVKSRARRGLIKVREQLQLAA